MSIAIDSSLVAGTAGFVSSASASAGDEEQATRPGELTDEERAEVRELQARDREVRAHEAAHQAAAGDLAQGVSFEYQRGPDGRLYAVGGEVKIDTAPVKGDPQATLEKAERIIRAALAPAEPSAKDRQVAAKARQMAAKARIELAKQRAEGAEQAQEPGAIPLDGAAGRPAPGGPAAGYATVGGAFARNAETGGFLDLLA